MTGTRQRIPGGEDRPGLDLLIHLDRQRSAIGHLVALALAAMLVVDDDFARARDHHQVALGVADIAHRRVETDHAIGLGLHARRHRRPRRCTADVECAHGELGARLADRLSSDHADRFADVDQAAAAQVAAIAARANAEAGFAGQRGAHFHFVDASVFQLVDDVFIEQGSGRQQHGLRFGMQHLFRCGAPQDTVAQRFDDFAAFDDGAHHRALVGSAIFLGHHQILGDVHQPAREIAGVRRFQRRIGQALARAVGRDEVLQNVQAFTEIGGDRGFDDRAIGLGHQAAHPRQLPDLRGRTARAGVGHHVDGIERFLVDLLAVAIGGFLLGELGHHHLRHFVAGLAPDVHHLVVALAGGHQAGRILLADFLHFLLGALDDAGLLRRHQHVVDGNGNAGLGRQAEAVLQQLVGKHHCLFQAAFAERDVDQLRDFLLSSTPC